MTAHPKLQKPPWRIDPSIDVNRVSLEDVKLIFSQAEKRLADDGPFLLCNKSSAGQDHLISLYERDRKL
jgi:hypothetical protein